MGKDWTGNKKTVFTTLGASNHTDKERQCEDYYATDPIAVDVLIGEGGKISSESMGMFLRRRSFIKTS